MGERLILRAGMLVWLDPAAARAWHGEARISEGVRGRGTELRFSLEGWESEAPPVHAEVPATAAGSCAALVAELRRFRAYRDIRCRALLTLVLSDLQRAAEEVPATGGRLLTAEERLQLERYLRRHFTRRIDSAELARELGCARLTLQRLVRRSYGVSARTWILHSRIRFAAALMLREELSVAETARRVGYLDSALFCRQFKQVCGVSPGAFRRQPTAVTFV